MKSSLLSVVLALAPGAVAWKEVSSCDDIKYTSVTGFFLQDDPKTDPSSFDYASWNFGLINRAYPSDAQFDPHHKKTQWQRFANYVGSLNDNRGKSNQVNYKVLFMGRHGEGWHNAAETFYGTPAWNCYWAEQDGNATAVWADAQLTPNGLAQANKANAYYKSRFEEEKLPYFQSYYSSPLKRCIQTANVTFAGLNLPHSNPFKPTVKELFRESISIHTCDRRSTKTQIHAFAPNFKFEEDFSETDELWRGNQDLGETPAHQVARSKIVIDDVFSHDDNTWISITSHSGEIESILTVLSHRPFSLSTGQIITVLVKAELVEPSDEATTTYASFTSEPTCKSPPVTSIAGQGCVCATATTSIFTTTTTTPRGLIADL
ncbi:phosphoglycerate mutase [Trichoderma cornu-damae]|uniref:Phosphoglycerate mutase n=1 Tax=Trichoderma cornu-damae TaxID=654480 RepID=A0A9P8QKN9_9HYPO|nr:phosphoglycerate mutase [Trichoderma cornu-damae]